MAVKRKQTRPEIALRRLERVLHEAEGEMPRALVRMPDDAVKETERIEESMRRLERLSWREKFTMAIDPKTDRYMLDALSRDEDAYVRFYVIGNENVSVEMLERLSEDKKVLVRSGVVGSRNVSVEILERLKNDSDKYVRDMAIKTLEKINRGSGIM
jgi:hypothetical protein